MWVPIPAAVFERRLAADRPSTASQVVAALQSGKGRFFVRARQPRGCWGPLIELDSTPRYHCGRRVACLSEGSASKLLPEMSFCLAWEPSMQPATSRGGYCCTAVTLAVLSPPDGRYRLVPQRLLGLLASRPWRVRCLYRCHSLCPGTSPASPFPGIRRWYSSQDSPVPDRVGRAVHYTSSCLDRRMDSVPIARLSNVSTLPESRRHFGTISPLDLLGTNLASPFRGHPRFCSFSGSRASERSNSRSYCISPFDTC